MTKVLFLALLFMARALPAASSPAILPSEQLQTYAANNLEHLLGPLNDGTLPRAELQKLEIEYQARLAQAGAAEKEVLQASLRVCAAFDKIMAERETAVAATHGAQAKNTESLGSTK